ncbi:hypothetical protein [Saccharicrinis carchari]|nr:hypothetical protein [Saccharicrinis carchari]
MKRFIINIFLITLLVAIVNGLYLALLYYGDITFIKRHESLHFTDPDFELLVMGNSLATDAFDTGWLSEQGLSSYNMAIPGSSIKTNCFQLNEYLSNYESKPKYVILGLGTYTGSFEDETIHPIVEFTSVGYRYSIDDLPMIKFRWLAIEMLKKMVSSLERNVKLSYGQFKFQKVQPDNTVYGENYFEMDRYLKSKYIQKIAAVCKVNKIKLILIEMPGFKEVQNKNEMGPYSLNFPDGSVGILYNLNNVEFGKLFDAKKHWIGNSHLNEYGAVRLTEEMYQIIFKNK